MQPQIRPWPFVLLFLLLVALSLLFVSYWSLLIIATLCLLPILLLFLVRALRTVPAARLIVGILTVGVMGFVVLVGLVLFLSTKSLYKATPPEQMHCEKYAMRLEFDPAHNTFKGDQEITVVGDVPLSEIAEANLAMTENSNANVAASGNPGGNRNSRVIVRTQRSGNTNSDSNPKSLDAADREKLTKMLGVNSGEIVEWSDKPVMEALARNDLIGWTIKDIEIVPAEDRYTSDSTRLPIRAHLFTNRIDLKTEKKGLFKYASEIRVPEIVDFNQENQGCQAEITVSEPQDVFLTHNLNGTFSETTLENNEVGQALTATKVRDRNNVIRFSYPSSFFQHPLTNKILNFSFLNAVLYLGSLVMGLIGYLLGVALDVFKDARLKPAATRFLRWLKLIKKPSMSDKP